MYPRRTFAYFSQFDLDTFPSDDILDYDVVTSADGTSTVAICVPDGHTLLYAATPEEIEQFKQRVDNKELTA